MTRAVLGVFPPEEMNPMVEELVGMGVEPQGISIIAMPRARGDDGSDLGLSRARPWHRMRIDGDERDGTGPLVDRAERLGPGGAPLLRALAKEGIPEALARSYLGELDSGSTLVMARVEPGRVGRAIEAMNRRMIRTVATAGAEVDGERASSEALPVYH